MDKRQVRCFGSFTKHRVAVVNSVIVAGSSHCTRLELPSVRQPSRVPVGRLIARELAVESAKPARRLGRSTFREQEWYSTRAHPALPKSQTPCRDRVSETPHF